MQGYLRRGFDDDPGALVKLDFNDTFCQPIGTTSVEKAVSRMQRTAGIAYTGVIAINNGGNSYRGDAREPDVDADE